MKSLIFTLGVICFTSFVQAQLPSFLTKQLSPAQQAHRQLVGQLLSGNHSQSAVTKPTTVKQRVIAQADHESNVVDSTAYRYSGARGANYNYNGMEFGYAEGYEGLYSPASPVMDQDMLADSIIHYENNQIDQIQIAHFRADNQMDTLLDLSGSADPATYIRIFNDQGYLTGVYALRNSSGTGIYDTVSYQGIYYNGGDKVIADTIWSYEGSGVYEYDRAVNYAYTNELLTTMSYYYFSGSPTGTLGMQAMLTYTPAGQLETMKTYYYDGTTTTLSYSDSFAYTTGIDYYTTWVEAYWDDGVEADVIQFVQHPGTNGLPDSVNVWQKDINTSTFEAIGVLRYTYNDQDNPASIVSLAYTSTDSFVRKFYYEEYDDAVSVATINDQSGQIAVYPNPFSEHIQIDWEKAPVSEARIQLCDLTGRIVFSQAIDLLSGRNSIAVGSLPPGLYWLQVQNRDGEAWSRKLIKK